MEQDSRAILQVPSRILAPALRLHQSTASAFSRPVDMTNGSQDRGVDLSTCGHSGIDFDSPKLKLNKHHLEESSTSSHCDTNKKHKKYSRKVDMKRRDKSESANLAENNSPEKIQAQHHEPKTKLSFSVDSIISKVTKSSDEGYGEYDRNDCDTRSSSPGSPESGRHTRERTVTPDADAQQSRERSTGPQAQERSPGPSSREDSHHTGDFSPLIRPSALPPGLAGLPYPFSPVGLSLPPWPGLSTAYNPSLFPAGPDPSTSAVPKLSSLESEYMVLHIISVKFVIDCGQFTLQYLQFELTS